MAASRVISLRPWYHPLFMIQYAILFPTFVYGGICLYLYRVQNTLTYPREATGAILSKEQAIKNARASNLVPWDHPTPGAASPQGYVRPDFAHPAPRGTIVVFHGNGDWAWSRKEYVDAFSQRGFRVFLYEYPGYGGRPGLPSEAAIVPDAQALVRSLAQAGYGPVYVWGESLGAGVAASVCADPALPVQGLALLTPWDNIANVGLSLYPYIPVRQLMTDKYDSIANLQHFPHPICVIRSTQDEVIPAPLTLNLFAHLPDPKKMILQEGYGHEDWPRSPDLAWWDDALNFIAPKKT